MVESMFTPAYRELITAIVDIRTEAGLTQRQLAELLGREQSFIGRIETGQRRVDLVEFAWICRACGVDPVKRMDEVVRRISTQLPASAAGLRRRT